MNATNSVIPTTESLVRAAQIREQIDHLEAELNGLLYGDGQPVHRAFSLNQTTNPVPGKLPGKRGPMSPAGRAKIAKAQRERWARTHAAEAAAAAAATAATAPVAPATTQAPATTPAPVTPVAAPVTAPTAPAPTTAPEVKAAVKPAKGSLLAAAA